MKADTIIKSEGMDALFEKLGLVNRTYKYARRQNKKIVTLAQGL